MKHPSFRLLSLAAATLLAAFSNPACAQNTLVLPNQLPIIPTPSSMELLPDSVVALQLPLTVEIDPSVDPASRKTILGQTGNLSALLPPEAGGAPLLFQLDSAIPREGYSLRSDPSGVIVKASGRAGFFYAMQTLRRMLGAETLAGLHGWTNRIPAVAITDSPRFPMRAFMLDVSRHFFTADEVKKLLRLMAAYKMNTFQWHLTDDQGWRLPVEGYPLLTTVGATFPANTAVSDFTRQELHRSDLPCGPFAYTPQEVHDIVAYADSLCITVIPEIEMPGHMAAAIAAYPELSCRPDSIHTVRDLHGISEDILDISNPRAMQFVRDVIDCAVSYFPGEFIHIGGDEAPTKAWQSSPSVRKLADKLKVKGADPEQRFRKLQNWFTSQVNGYARSKGKRLAVWDEIVTAPGADIEMATAVNPLVTAYDIVWDRPVQQSLDAGLECIYSPFGPYYTNRRLPGDRIGAGGGRVSLEDIYTHPVPEEPNVRGLQATFWTEWVGRMCDLEYLALPRIVIVAENAWTTAGPKDFGSFSRLLDLDRTWLDAAGYRYLPPDRWNDPQK